MDPRLLIFLVTGVALLVQSVCLAVAALLGAWVYRCGIQRTSPIPQLPGRGRTAAPADEEEGKKPYHRKPPKP
jgi:hypothetical protein